MDSFRCMFPDKEHTIMHKIDIILKMCKKSSYKLHIFQTLMRIDQQSTILHRFY